MTKLSILFLSSILLLSTPYHVNAEELKLDVQTTNATKATLEKLIGKKAAIRIAESEELSGTVQSVGPDALVLSQLTGKEYFDAVIPLDKVVAVIVKTR